MNLPSIVGLAGFPNSGQDAFADVLTSEAGYTKAAFADAAERECAAWLGMPVEEFRSGDFGAMLERRMAERQEKFPGYWRNYLGRRFRLSASKTMPSEFLLAHVHDSGVSSRFVVPDVTYASDAEFLRSLGGVIVRVVKRGAVDPSSNTERAAEDIAYDHYVDGYGERHLREQARCLLEKWRER